MTVYYVNSLLGSDNNSGASEDKPLASIQAVNNLKLKAGDSVLFSSDSTFEGQLNIKYSGKEGNPITFGSYGEGSGPVLTGGETGIYGSKTSYITIENLTITNTKMNAMYAGSAHDWVVNNVNVIDTGSDTRAGSISFQSSKNMTITNSTMTGVHNEGIWIKNVDGVTLVNNTVNSSVGRAADAIQINDSFNIVVRDNHLDMTGETGSVKGVLVLVNVKDVLIDGNVLAGGGFGMGVLGQNVTITNNEISHYAGYSWSYGITLGDTVDARNYVISNNYIHDGVWGVSITAAGNPDLTRENIEIFNNIFEDLTKSALKVDRPAAGSFHDNVVAAGTSDIFISKIVAPLGTFTATGSEMVSDVQSRVDVLFGRTSEPPSHDTDVTLPSTGSEDTPAHPSTPSEPTTPTENPGDHSPQNPGSGDTIETPHQPAETPTESVPDQNPPSQPTENQHPQTPETGTGQNHQPETPEAPKVDHTDLIQLPKDTSMVAKADIHRLDGAHGLVLTGNVVDNDHSGNDIALLRSIAGLRIGKDGLTVEGKYGSIHIEENGDFTYSVHADALPDSGKLVDKFQYKVSNTVEMAVSYVSVEIDSHSLLSHYAADHMLV